MNKNFKIAFYTVCIGGDIAPEYHTKLFIDKNVDYYLFTDKDISIKNFKVIKITKKLENDNTRSARYIKVCGHPILSEYDYLIWMDSRLSPKFENGHKLIKEHLINHNSDIAFFKHYCRDCVYDEALDIINLKKDYKDMVENQMDKYKKNNYPEKNGLFETTFYIKNNKNIYIKNLMDEWWEEIKNFSRRDQLSINYLSFKNNINFSYMKKNRKHMNIRKNEYVTNVPNLCRKNNKVKY